MSSRVPQVDDEIMVRAEVADTFEDFSGTDDEDSDYDSGSSYYSSRSRGKEKGAPDEDGEDEHDDKYIWREPPPLDLNYEALKHVASLYLPGNHGNCVDVTTLAKGAFHEVEVLHFEDGWTCIGRFTRSEEHLDKSESELAAMDYVRAHTSIRVPETYLANSNPNHVVGAAFVLMERLPGAHLGTIWGSLSLEHKMVAVEQIADVLTELSKLRFSTIGSLKSGGSVGPLRLQHLKDMPSSPYTTLEEYMLSFMPYPNESPEEINELNYELRGKLLETLQTNERHPVLNGPYRLIHGDFDCQNMLFIHTDKSRSPKLSGIIDWDYSYTGPLYELLEYPIWLQDVHWSPQLYVDNKILRKHLVRCLADKFPEGSEERRQVKECFRMKSWLLQNFQTMWACDEDDVSAVRFNLEVLNEGMERAYEGRRDWEADSEIESDVEESSEEGS